MTPSSKAARTRRVYTDDEKRHCVSLMKSRGEGKSIRELAAELNVRPQMLHYWAARVQSDEPLTPPAEAPPPPAAVVKRKAGRPKGSTNRQLEITLAAPPAHQQHVTSSERDELVLLRAEVAKLRRMVAASMMTEQDLGGTAWSSHRR